MEQKIEKIETIFKSLGLEKRLRILNLVICSPDKTVSEISNHLHIPLQTASRNLILLADAGLIKGRQTNSFITYRAKVDGLYGSNIFLLSMVKKAYEADSKNHSKGSGKTSAMWLGDYKVLKDYINL